MGEQKGQRQSAGEAGSCDCQPSQVGHSGVTANRTGEGAGERAGGGALQNKTQRKRDNQEPQNSHKKGGQVFSVRWLLGAPCRVDTRPWPVGDDGREPGVPSPAFQQVELARTELPTPSLGVSPGAGRNPFSPAGRPLPSAWRDCGRAPGNQILSHRPAAMDGGEGLRPRGTLREPACQRPQRPQRAGVGPSSAAGGGRTQPAPPLRPSSHPLGAGSCPP